MSSFDYNDHAHIPQSLLDATIEEYFPQLTREEIDTGVFVRYFVRQTNHKQGEILEINKRTFERLQGNTLYKTVSINWKIAGPLDDIPGPNDKNSPTRLFTGVLTANRLSLEEANKVIPGITEKILNMAQFYQFDGRALRTV